jgi:hypothetical protein
VSSLAWIHFKKSTFYQDMASLLVTTTWS